MKKKKILIGIVILTLIWIAGAIGMSTENQPSPKDTDFSQASVSKESVITELEGASDSGYKIKLENITDVTVTDNLGTDEPNDKIVNVSYTFDSWDGEDIVSTSIATSVEIFKRMFNNPAISRVVTLSQQDFIDNKGNTETSTAIKLLLDRSETEGVNWDGIKERVLMDYNTIFSLVTTYSIHPSLHDHIEM